VGVKMSNYIRNFENLAKEQYSMKLDDVLAWDGEHNFIEIRRVPGGWIYTFTDKSCPVMNSVFVPYNNEFQE
jgi:hypothetical protein